MEESTSREKILKNVRNALISKGENPYKLVDMDAPVYQPMEDTEDVNFAQEFTKIGGKFVYCINEDELAENLRSLLDEKKWESIYTKETELIRLLVKEDIPVESNPEKFLKQLVGMTFCEYLIARTGSILISSGSNSGRRMYSFPEIHIVVGFTSQLVPFLSDAIRLLQEKYGKNLPSLITTITGPSRTADIEKTLVMGAHGPKELFVFLVEDSQ